MPLNWVYFDPSSRGRTKIIIFNSNSAENRNPAVNPSAFSAGDSQRFADLHVRRRHRRHGENGRLLTLERQEEGGHGMAAPPQGGRRRESGDRNLGVLRRVSLAREAVRLSSNNTMRRRMPRTGPSRWMDI